MVLRWLLCIKGFGQVMNFPVRHTSLCWTLMPSNTTYALTVTLVQNLLKATTSRENCCLENFSFHSNFHVDFLPTFSDIQTTNNHDDRPLLPPSAIAHLSFTISIYSATARNKQTHNGF